MLPSPAKTTVEPTLDLSEWCKRLGWRVTESRLTILRATLSLEGYFDAEKLVTAAKRFDAGASRATIYRALPQMCAGGFLHKTEVGEGRELFCRSKPGEVPSAEIYIEDCGMIVRVPAPFLTWYAASITERIGLQVTGHRLQTFARCTHKRSGGECEKCPNISSARAAHVGRLVAP